MQDATNLRVTTEARLLALEVYRATSMFPDGERFGLTSQMRRCAVSIGSNIAEGCGRFGNRELVQFLQIALGSVSELEYQAEIATDLAFFSKDAAPPLLDRIRKVKAMLIRLIKSHRSRKLASVVAEVH
jgi:four helix bundle protein